MCGICGVIGVEPKEASEAIVRRMMNALVHRGPDDEGIVLAPPIGAGMRRLSILDVPGGGQPIWNETRTVAVVFNGEIYNFPELRAELESAGHQFRTRSDTEVIVHAYEEWGQACVQRLHGMFAFCIVEAPEERKGRAVRVFLARDRMGIKPLYYAVVNGILVFASEVRAVLASGYIAPRVSAEALPSYLLFGSVCEPMTLVDGIVSLPPGHTMTVPAITPVRTSQGKPYWTLEQSVAAGTEARLSQLGNPSSCAAHTRTLLEESVRSHLIADVPVGVFLSSGVDSTALAALASRVQEGVRTFTVGFPDGGFSEAELARYTAAQLGTEHNEVNLTEDDLLARLDEAVFALDQPSMDGINTYFVSWAAAQSGLKVALSGLGSDEIFGGYPTFRATSTLSILRKFSDAIPRGVREVVSRGCANSPAFRASSDKIKKAVSAWLGGEVLPHEYFFTRLLFTPEIVAGGQTGGSVWAYTRWWQWLADNTEQSRYTDTFTGISWLELRSYLVNTLLRDTDATSMRNSLEVRVPFLDADLVDYVLSLPTSYKRVQGVPKSLLIEAVGDLLPPEVVAQKKRTFTFPWDNWLRGALGSHVSAGLIDWSPALEPVLTRDFAHSVWKSFLAGHTTWSRPWSLYVLNEWAKQNLRATSGRSTDRRAAAANSH